MSSQRVHFQTSCPHSWLQCGLVCSKAMTLISCISHTHLLNLPRKIPLLLLPPSTFSGSWMLMQKWSGQCLQLGGPYRCTIIFTYRASKKSLTTKLCTAGHALRQSPGRVSKWEFQGLLSTIISQVNQYKSIWHWRLGVWNIWEDIFQPWMVLKVFFPPGFSKQAQVHQHPMHSQKRGASFPLIPLSPSLHLQRYFPCLLLSN